MRWRERAHHEDILAYCEEKAPSGQCTVRVLKSKAKMTHTFPQHSSYFPYYMMLFHSVSTPLPPPPPPLSLLYSPCATMDSSPNVTRSPRLAAKGVATLSGLILRRWEVRMMRIMREAKRAEATEALNTLEDTSNRMWEGLKSCSTTRAMAVAKRATTMAWA